LRSGDVAVDINVVGSGVGPEQLEIGADLFEDVAGLMDDRVFNVADHIEEKEIAPLFVLGRPGFDLGQIDILG
jgi:hypothetical protein